MSVKAALRALRRGLCDAVGLEGGFEVGSGTERLERFSATRGGGAPESVEGWYAAAVCENRWHLGGVVDSVRLEGALSMLARAA